MFSMTRMQKRFGRESFDAYENDCLHDTLSERCKRG